MRPKAEAFLLPFSLRLGIVERVLGGSLELDPGDVHVKDVGSGHDAVDFAGEDEGCAADGCLDDGAVLGVCVDYFVGTVVDLFTGGFA